MGSGLIGRHLCCLECGLKGEGEAAVADDGGDGEGENAMHKLSSEENYVIRELNGKKFPTLGQSTNERATYCSFF